MPGDMGGRVRPGDIGALVDPGPKPGLMGVPIDDLLTLPGDMGARVPIGLGTKPGDGMGWFGVVQRWFVGVFLPATTFGFTIFSSCCKLDPGPPPPIVGTGEALDDGGMEAGDDTGVVIPKLEFGLA